MVELIGVLCVVLVREAMMGLMFASCGAGVF